jgi:hypothetical protein
MTAHPSGRKLGVHLIPPPDLKKCKGIKVLGISGSSRQKEGMSKSENILLKVLDIAKSYGAVTNFIRLQDLKRLRRQLFPESRLLHLSMPEFNEI